MVERVSRSREIGASPQAVWDLVSDLPRMGQWSDENAGGRWLGSSGPAVGAKFLGQNKQGLRRWATLSTVTECDPGQRFRFEVNLVGIPISAWAYTIEPTPSGCEVTEEWADRRPGWFKPISKIASGVANRAEYAASSIDTTLAKLAATAESR